jgi:hypothetical protein
MTRECSRHSSPTNGLIGMHGSNESVMQMFENDFGPAIAKRLRPPSRMQSGRAMLIRRVWRPRW